MTMPSRGISDIQRKARGNKMAKEKRGMPTLPKSEKMKAKVVKRGAPSPDDMMVGAARAPIPATSGLRATGFKSGGCAMKKGGSIDGIAKKGHTKGKMC